MIGLGMLGVGMLVAACRVFLCRRKVRLLDELIINTNHPPILLLLCQWPGEDQKQSAPVQFKSNQTTIPFAGLLNDG